MTRATLLLSALLVATASCDRADAPARCASGSCDETNSVFLVPMRDGTSLRTRVFLPDDLPQAGLPTVMIRSPYFDMTLTPPDRPSPAQQLVDRCRFLNRRGYACVIQRSRGGHDTSRTHDEPLGDGRSAPAAIELTDGRDLTDWIAAQVWSNGAIGAIGGSADGYNALAAAVDNPRVKVVIADDAPQSTAYEIRGGTHMVTFLVWYAVVYRHSSILGDALVRFTNALDPVPLDRDVLGFEEPFWREYLASSAADEHWKAESIGERIDDICAPVLSIHMRDAGWTDPIRTWQQLREHGCAAHRGDHRLVVSPEPHSMHIQTLEAPPDSDWYREVNQLMLDYLDKFLAGKPIDLSDAPAVLYASEPAKLVRGSPTWPPPGKPLFWFLDNAGVTPLVGTLSPAPPLGMLPDQLAIDPAVADPCDLTGAYPTAFYFSAPLPAPLYLAGSPRLELSISVTTPDADLFVRLMDYDPNDPLFLNGPPRRISYGAQRLRWREGGTKPVPVAPGTPLRLAIDLFPIAYEIPAGHVVAIEIAGGMCGFIENAHTGQPLTQQTHTTPTLLSIFHQFALPARLTLPVVD